ncbi:MAG: cytidine deaminase, partial [Acetobacterium sp.]|nr:cytidine deaminase [Acetobacterium sp.]
CAKAIIQAGIKKVVYLEDKYPDTDATKASKRLFKMAEISLREFPNPSFYSELSLY